MRYYIFLLFLVVLFFSACRRHYPPLLNTDLTEIDFGKTDTERNLIVSNNGGDDLIYEIDINGVNWLKTSIYSDTLASGESDVVCIYLDRSKLDCEICHDEIFISSNGGDLIIEVKAINTK